MIGRLFGILSIIGGGYLLLCTVSTAVALARKLWEKRHDRHKDSHFLSVWRHRHL